MTNENLNVVPEPFFEQKGTQITLFHLATKKYDVVHVYEEAEV